jgi:hypothetical protein
MTDRNGPAGVGRRRCKFQHVDRFSTTARFWKSIKNGSKIVDFNLRMHLAFFDSQKNPVTGPKT